MKRTFTKLMAALALLLFIAPLGMWGQGRGSYTITFGNNASSATAISSTTNASTVISNGANYVTSKPFTINSGNCYYGDTKTCIRIGKSKNASSLSIALSDNGKVSATSIVVNCKNMGGSGNSDAQLNVNSIGSQVTNSTTATDITFTFSMPTQIESIKLEGTKAIYIYSITVNYDVPTPSGDNIIIDFENNQLPDGWTNVNEMEVVTNPISNSSSTNGSYCLSTNGKASNSITSGLIANVVSISVQAAKTSNNTNDNVFIDFCPDNSFGSSSTQTKSVTVSQNSWTTSTLTLSSTSNGYVRIRRSGGSSTATKFIDNIVITIDNGGTSSPSITANNVNIAYDAVEGDIEYEIGNPVEGASIQTLVAAGATITNFQLGTPANGVIHFTCAANATNTIKTATVTLNYVNGDETLATKDVTITQDGNPDAVDNIEDITASNTQYKVRGTVVATNSRGFVMGDGTGYVYYYKNSAPDQSVGDKITLEGTTSTYGHVLQFQGTPTIAPSATSNYDGTPAATVITAVPDYTSGLHLSTYFQFEGTLSISSSNYLIAVGSETIQVSYPTDAQTTAMAALEGKNVRVKGYFSGINSSNYFTVMMESVEEVTDPYITIESDAFELTANKEESYLEITYGNFTPISFDIMYCDANGNELSDYPEWITLAIETPAGEEGDFVHYDVEPNNGAARTAYFKVYASLGEGQETVYSNLVAITQAAPVVDYASLPFVWEGGTSAALGDEDGVTVVSDSDYAAQNAPYRVKFSASTHYILVKTDDQPAVVSVGIKKFGDGNASTLIIEGSADGQDFTTVETFSITGAQNDELTYITTNAFNTNYRYVKISFNKPSSGGANVGVGPITIKGIETYTLENITGYTGEKDHYFLIASPVTVDPSTVAGMTTGDFDLYRFNQAAALEWENWKNEGSDNYHFNLVPGTGYLYAKKATTENPTYTFQLTGIPYAGKGTIDLDYDADAEFPGFNLIGNPFGTNANLVDMPYYRLNSDGSALNTSTESTPVFVMEGVFVEATSTIRTATFSPAAKRVSQLNVKVTRNRSAVLDNAIIRFDNGAALGKFQLNPNSTKLYITEGNQDYAVVRSNNEGEMPVSFKAEKSGSYTINVEAENVEMNYLHLIDNLTGMDVDLLQTPSYSFEANTRDYANRFKLVFKANTGVEENTATETFAYFNGSEWVINNPSTGSGDNATLQVIDMMGRVLSSQTISGNANVNINQPAGVYVLRLINGENVKVQKVVVR